MILPALVRVMDTDMAVGDVQLSRHLRGFVAKDRYGIDTVAQLVSAEADDVQVAARDLHSGNLGCLVGIGEFRIDAVACVIAVLADGKERGVAGDADGSASFPTVGIDACAEVRAFAAGGLHGGVAGDGETLFVANGLDAKGVCRRAGRGNDLTAGDGEGAVIGDADALAAVHGAGFGNDGASVDLSEGAGDAVGLRHITRCRSRGRGKLAAADGEFV